MVRMDGWSAGVNFKSGLGVIVSAPLSEYRASSARRPDGWDHFPSNSCWLVNNGGKEGGVVVVSLKKGVMVSIVVGMIFYREVQALSLCPYCRKGWIPSLPLGHIVMGRSLKPHY